MLRKNQIDYAEKVAKDLITADLVADLISMLREAQKDAARWKYWRRMWANEQCDNDHHLPESVILILNDADLNEAMDEAMQLDCDGAQRAEGGE